MTSSSCRQSPTGKPDAGNPPVRFGGRGGATQCATPTLFFFFFFFGRRPKGKFSRTLIWLDSGWLTRRRRSLDTCHWVIEKTIRVASGFGEMERWAMTLIYLDSRRAAEGDAEREPAGSGGVPTLLHRSTAPRRGGGAGARSGGSAARRRCHFPAFARNGKIQDVKEQKALTEEGTPRQKSGLSRQVNFGRSAATDLCVERDGKWVEMELFASFLLAHAAGSGLVKREIRRRGKKERSGGRRSGPGCCRAEEGGESVGSPGSCLH